MNKELAKTILTTRLCNFARWDYPCGDGNLAFRKSILSEIAPGLVGKRGKITTAQASVSNYRKILFAEIGVSNDRDAEQELQRIAGIDPDPNKYKVKKD